MLDKQSKVCAPLNPFPRYFFARHNCGFHLNVNRLAQQHVLLDMHFTILFSNIARCVCSFVIEAVPFLVLPETKTRVWALREIFRNFTANLTTKQNLFVSVL